MGGVDGIVVLVPGDEQRSGPHGDGELSNGQGTMQKALLQEIYRHRTRAVGGGEGNDGEGEEGDSGAVEVCPSNILMVSEVKSSCISQTHAVSSQAGV